MGLFFLSLFALFIFSFIGAVPILLFKNRKQIPAILLFVLNLIGYGAGIVLYVLLSPIVIPYALYKNWNKWNTTERMLVSISYTAMMLFYAFLIYDSYT